MSKGIDEAASPTFKRHIADQQFLRDFKKNHPIWYYLWRLSSNCGRSFGIWMFWSLFIALFFGGLYATHPAWFQQEVGSLSPWYFSIWSSN